ncbi:MAG: tryptophan--tRNA ligase [Sulfolobales archaeon]|nr:tryptophan--tRNA ligase [Sulfolobales archaeon]MDW8082253.1 tryptophan--tRNA ligase [Sulfolobales archaeon]
MEESVQVGPWAAEAFVDYEKLLKVFGAKPLTDSEVHKLERLAGESHLMLRRRVFYSHRDLDMFLNMYEAGYRCALYTGRGPSGSTHLGHILPWVFTKWLQDRLGLELFFQMTDDEKFLHEERLDLPESNSFAYENSLDLIALEFEPRKTHIIIDTEDIGYLYPVAVKVAKKITYSTQKATFGFTDSTNVGLVFYPVLQIAVSYLPTELYGEETYVLIPAGIDQDPYWRIARDIAQSLGYPKPSQIHNKLLPGLGPEGKMSSSKPETAVYTTDPPEIGAQKVMRAFTGGQPTVELQRKLGGNPDRCSVFKMYEMLFEEDDSKLSERYWNCRTGSLLCGDCKAELASRVQKFLREFQERRDRGRDKLHQYLIRSKFSEPKLKHR